MCPSLLFECLLFHVTKSSFIKNTFYIMLITKIKHYNLKRHSQVYISACLVHFYEMNMFQNLFVVSLLLNNKNKVYYGLGLNFHLQMIIRRWHKNPNPPKKKKTCWDKISTTNHSSIMLTQEPPPPPKEQRKKHAETKSPQPNTHFYYVDTRKAVIAISISTGQEDHMAESYTRPHCCLLPAS